ncbi:zinc finger protein 558-like, partial [Centruroides vittatus]|uniref:zinc finger protein 558-like n=1 Tax=Centruroides vittatus TaxID=120091 RepID=UPI00350EF8D9
TVFKINSWVSYPPRYQNLEKYRCKFCPKFCSSPSALKLHERSHTGEKPFQCDYCFKRFSEKRYLNNHKRKFHLTQEKQSSFQETEETDAEVLRAAEILVDIRKKRLEMIKDEKKCPDPDTPPSSQ